MRQLLARQVFVLIVGAAALGVGCSPAVDDSDEEEDDVGGGNPAGASGSSTGGRPGTAGTGGSAGTTGTGGSGGAAGARGGADGGTSSADAPRASDAAPIMPPTADAGSTGGQASGYDGPPNVPLGAIPVVWLEVPGRTPDSLPGPNSDKVAGTVKFIQDHDGTHRNLSTRPAALTSPMGITKRGSSSQGFPQKSFSIELRDAMNKEKQLPVLGMPPEADWALVACWTDKPCMRNALAYSIGRELGRWNPRFRFVEVFFNGSYQGLYQLVEPPRQDRYRVPIPKPAADMTGGDALTGGYIIRREAGGKGSSTVEGRTYARDWISPTTAPGMWPHQIIYTYHFPKEHNITSAQRSYIHKHIADFEAAMKASDYTARYKDWIDVTSWADFMIIQELVNNVDGYWKSFYLTKLPDAGGARGKLVATPLWDFNLGFGNADYRDGWRTDILNFTGLTRFGGECTSRLPRGEPLCAAGCCTNMCPSGAKCWNIPIVPFYWEQLQKDSAFRNEMKCRWRELRKTGGALDMAQIDRWIMEWKAELEKFAVPRHFQKWPALRDYVWPNPYRRDPSSAPVPGASVQDFFNKEVTWMRNWVDRRIRWLDTNLPGTCNN